MIITRLKGGLGNQMFQYALGRKLALKNNDLLKLDISGYQHDNLRSYSLEPFAMSAEIAKQEEITRLKYPLGIFSFVWRYFSFKVLRQFHTGWEPAILEAKGNLYLDGFWQSYKYFADIADTIRADFTLKEPLEQKYPELVQQVHEGDSISLHVRRTDYVSSKKHQKNFGTLSLEHYQKAIRLAKENRPNPTLFIFTDDPNWVKNNLQTDVPTIYISNFGLRDYEELILMSYCKSHIIANSSFSWWGAWLDPRPDKIVIAPTHWTQSGEPKTDDIIPPSWQKI